MPARFAYGSIILYPDMDQIGDVTLNVETESPILLRGVIHILYLCDHTTSVANLKMPNTHTLRGFATINFYAADHAAAKNWYSEFLGMEPYFNVPGYAEFRIGDYQHELGIIDRAYAPDGATQGPAGAITYWHVDDLKATFDRLIALGATVYQPITPRGTNGFVTASVVDPFGNILGIMSNPHYLEIFNT